MNFSGHSTTDLVTQPSGQSGECITGDRNVSAKILRPAGTPSASVRPCIVSGTGRFNVVSVVGATSTRLTGASSTPRREECGYFINSPTCSRFWYGELA